MSKLKINGEILKYHREFDERSIHEVADILDVDDEIIEKLETKDCVLNEKEFKIAQRYARLVGLGFYGLFMNFEVSELYEYERKIGIREHLGYFTVYAKKDNSRISFDVSKEAVIKLVKDCVEALAYSYR